MEASIELGLPIGLAKMHGEILERLTQLRKANGDHPSPDLMAQIGYLEFQLGQIQEAMTGLGPPVTGTVVGSASRDAAHRPAR